MGIQFMQILGLLSMYFNAVVVFVKKSALSVLSGKGSCLKKGGGGGYIINEFLNQKYPCYQHFCN